MNWRHQEVHPVARTIGAASDCDFVRVVKGKGIALLPLVFPFNLEHTFETACVFVASLQVRANEADSAMTQIKVSWDGEWHDGDLEMASHLVVKDVAGAA